jgi:hypothetical protein
VKAAPRQGALAARRAASARSVHSRCMPTTAVPTGSEEIHDASRRSSTSRARWSARSPWRMRVTSWTITTSVVHSPPSYSSEWLQRSQRSRPSEVRIWTSAEARGRSGVAAASRFSSRTSLPSWSWPASSSL